MSKPKRITEEAPPSYLAAIRAARRAKSDAVNKKYDEWLASQADKSAATPQFLSPKAKKFLKQAHKAEEQMIAKEAAKISKGTNKMLKKIDKIKKNNDKAFRRKEVEELMQRNEAKKYIAKLEKEAKQYGPGGKKPNSDKLYAIEGQIALLKNFIEQNPIRKLTPASNVEKAKYEVNKIKNKLKNIFVNDTKISSINKKNIRDDIARKNEIDRRNKGIWKF